MKNIALGLFALSLAFAPIAFAERGSEDARVRTNSSVNITCVGTAVGVREDAIMSAWSKFDDAVTAVLTARKTALVAAWSLTDTSTRKNAVKAAWATAKKDRKAVANTHKSERRAAWTSFKTAARACGGNDGSDAAVEKDSGAEVTL
ncbi:MAG: hypothetical protein Q8O46_01570 [bacterium]|nr:hypothetical protein [bacterium]